MIRFEVVRWKNLLSTGNAFTEVRLDRGGTTLVIGPNGSGKTTLGEALALLLFNRSLRDVNKNELVNSINGKDCVVEGSFVIGEDLWLARRGIKPNFFEIYKNGERVEEEDRSATEHQAWFEQSVLRFNFKAFCQVVFLAAANYVPFMKLRTGDRRKVVEDLLDIQVFSKMNKLLKALVDENVASIREMDLQAQGLRDRVSMQENFERVMNEDVEQRVREIEAKQEVLLSERAGKLAEGVKFSEELESLAVDPEWEGAAWARTNADREIQRCRTLEGEVKKRVRFFEDNSDCPTCKQGIEDGHKKGILAKEEAELKELWWRAQKAKGEHALADALCEAKAKHDERVSSIKLQMKLLRDGIGQVDKLVASLEQEKEQARRKQDRVIPQGDETLDDMRVALDEIDSRRKEAYAERGALQYSAALLKDEGIKAGIVKLYVPKINQMINKYLAELDFYVDFNLDENFDETIRSRHRDKFSYESFSEGEKFRINIAILFAWRAISRARNSVSTNILIMDEVMDSSLDTTGTEEFVKVLKQLLDGTSTFIISHRGDQLVDKFDRVLEAKKIKNFSTMQEQT